MNRMPHLWTAAAGGCGGGGYGKVAGDGKGAAGGRQHCILTATCLVMTFPVKILESGASSS